VIAAHLHWMWWHRPELPEPLAATSAVLVDELARRGELVRCGHVHSLAWLPGMVEISDPELDAYVAAMREMGDWWLGEGAWRMAMEVRRARRGQKGVGSSQNVPI